MYLLLLLCIYQEYQKETFKDFSYGVWSTMTLYPVYIFCKISFQGLPCHVGHQFHHSWISLDTQLSLVFLARMEKKKTQQWYTSRK